MRIAFLSIEGECAAVVDASRALAAAVVVAEPVAVETVRAVGNYVWNWGIKVRYWYLLADTRGFRETLEESSAV